jgi:hypothetical protein
MSGREIEFTLVDLNVRLNILSISLLTFSVSCFSLLKDLIVLIEPIDSASLDVSNPNPTCVFLDIFLSLFPILLIGYIARGKIKREINASLVS